MKPFQTSFVFLALFLLFACGGAHKVEQQTTDFASKGNRALSKGNSKYRQGCYKGALEYFFRAHEIFAASDDPHGVAMSLNNIGTVYRALGDFQTAMRFFDQALTVYHDLADNREILQVLSNQSAALIGANRLEEGERALQRAENLARKHNLLLTPLFINRGILFLRKKDYASAEKILADAVAQTDESRPLEFAAVNFALGNLMSQTGRLEKALDHYHHALSFDRRAGFHKGVADDLAAIGETYQKRGEFRKALSYFSRGIKIYALLENEAKVNELLAKLEAASEKTESDITLTRHFIDSWLAGDVLESPCD